MNKNKKNTIKNKDLDDVKKGKENSYTRQQEGRKRRFEAIYWELEDAESRGKWMSLEHISCKESTSVLLTRMLEMIDDPEDLAVINKRLQEYTSKIHVNRAKALYKANNNDVKEERVLDAINGLIDETSVN